MVLLDQERQAAKESAAQLRVQLVEVSDKSEANRDRAVELEATVRQMAGQNDSLESELAKEANRSAELSVALEEQKTDRESLQREFDAYKDEYKISGDLHALQSAVTALQDKLEQRKDQ